MAVGLRLQSGEPISVIVPTRYYAYTAEGRRFSLSAAADFLAEAGFDGVDVSLDTVSELNGRDGDNGWRSVLYSFGNRAAACGLTLPVCHLPFYMPSPDDPAAMARFARELANGLSAAALLKIPDAVIHPIVRHSSRCTYTAWRRENLDFLTPLCELAGKLGVGLAIENMTGVPYPDHPREVVYGSRAKDILYLAEQLDCGLCWDFGHANLTGLCQSAEMEQLRGRLRVVHIHDNDGVQDTHLVPAVGGKPSAVGGTVCGAVHGGVDWDDAAEGLRLAGFLSTSNRCLDFEVKTSDLPADHALRLTRAADVLCAARRLANQL